MVELIKYTRYKNYYAKRTKNGFSFVRRREATIFFNGEAQIFIDTTITESERQYCEIIEAENFIVNESISKAVVEPKLSIESDSVAAITDDISSYAENKFSALKRRLEESLEYYDNAIVDILHFLGDENCKLNAAQLCKVAKKLQELERGHTIAKKELNRLKSVISEVYDIGLKAGEFDYQPYKPKAIHNLSEII